MEISTWYSTPFDPYTMFRSAGRCFFLFILLWRKRKEKSMSILHYSRLDNLRIYSTIVLNTNMIMIGQNESAIILNADFFEFWYTEFKKRWNQRRKRLFICSFYSQKFFLSSQSFRLHVNWCLTSFPMSFSFTSETESSGCQARTSVRPSA